MLFDIYFNLGGFFFGLYAGFAFHAQPNGTGHALALRLVLPFLCYAWLGSAGTCGVTLKKINGRWREE